VHTGSDTDYNNFTNWNVSDGTVDLVAQGDWGLNCAGYSGKCVDLDGSSGNAGIFSSNALTLAAGTYTLSFDISGSQRPQSFFDEMQVTLGGFFNEDFSRVAFQGWETVTRTFNIAQETTDVISFNHAGADNMGIMLDNVVLSTDSENSVSVDEPATFALLGLGLLGLGAARRKQQA
ncbi:PEP-CTERM domain protein, partial [Oleiphilus sp. HI0061]